MITFMLSALLVAWFVAIVYLNYRIGKAYSLGIQNVVDVYSASIQDISSGNKWRWRYDELDEVSFYSMVFSFKPIRNESFYDDLSFLDPNATKEN